MSLKVRDPGGEFGEDPEDDEVDAHDVELISCYHFAWPVDELVDDGFGVEGENEGGQEEGDVVQGAANTAVDFQRFEVHDGAAEVGEDEHCGEKREEYGQRDVHHQRVCRPVVADVGGVVEDAGGLDKVGDVRAEFVVGLKHLNVEYAMRVHGKDEGEEEVDGADGEHEAALVDVGDKVRGEGGEDLKHEHDDDKHEDDRDVEVAVVGSHVVVHFRQAVDGQTDRDAKAEPVERGVHLELHKIRDVDSDKFELKRRGFGDVESLNRFIFSLFPTVPLV